MKPKLLLIALIILVFTGSVTAETKLQPEIKSIQNTLKHYSSKQKVYLYIDLATVYAKSMEWNNFYSKVENIFKECPRLKKVKLNFTTVQKKPIKDSKDYIDPQVVKKLSKFNLEYINTKEKALDYLELLKPLCSKICPLNTSINNGPPPVPGE